MQDRPDATELLTALARWLYQDLRPTLEGEQRFLALVAANSCAILAREWALDGPGAPDRTEQRELARSIRAGEWDDRWDDVLERLRAEARAKLAVAHPGYDAIADDGRDDKEQ
jgi:Domain of unknown function (DUF6285)